MKRLGVRIVVFVFAIVFASSVPLLASAEQPPARPANPALMLLDVFIVRPVGVGVSTASTSLAVATAPLTWALGVGPPAAFILVEWPWTFTSGRYAGHFNRYRSDRPRFAFSRW